MALLQSYVPSSSAVTMVCLCEMQYQQHGLLLLTKHSYTVILAQSWMKCITSTKCSSLLEEKDPLTQSQQMHMPMSKRCRTHQVRIMGSSQVQAVDMRAPCWGTSQPRTKEANRPLNHRNYTRNVQEY